MSTSDRELARHWREWAEDTGSNVVRAAEQRAQGIGSANMRSLLAFAFMAGWHARRGAEVRTAVSEVNEANLRRAVREAIDMLQEAAK